MAQTIYYQLESYSVNKLYDLAKTQDTLERFAGRSRYRLAWVDVYGEVDCVYEGDTNIEAVSINDRIECCFTDPYPKSETIKRGDNIKVRGYYNRMVNGNVLLSGCKLVPPVEPDWGLWRKTLSNIFLHEKF